MTSIDTTFDSYSDTPSGKDPDTFSPTLRRYHQILWSKDLPSGEKFELDLNTPRLLHHKSDLGEFYLSSDSLGHTYKNTKKMGHITGQFTADEMDLFFSICSTIGAYIIFPAKQIDKKMTINGARGMNHKIQDRFDLTLECIRLFYLEKNSPLTDTFVRYSSFFSLFSDFKGYVNFFLLQDLVDENCSEIKFWCQFKGFDHQPLPRSVSEYRGYKNNLTSFVTARNKRIVSFSAL